MQDWSMYTIYTGTIFHTEYLIGYKTTSMFPKLTCLMTYIQSNFTATSYNNLIPKVKVPCNITKSTKLNNSMYAGVSKLIPS